MKPHKGKLVKWWKHYPLPQFGSEGLGYLILGIFVDHPEFAGEFGNTSWVISHNEETGEIETANSRYTLIGQPIKEPFRGDKDTQ